MNDQVAVVYIVITDSGCYAQQTHIYGVFADESIAKALCDKLRSECLAVEVQEHELIGRLQQGD